MGVKPKMVDHKQAISFVRTCNDDLTIHSYCCQCLATVADAMSAAQAKTVEEDHKCDPQLLAMVQKYRKVSHLVSVA
jgi:hypothetical protein